MDVAAVDDVSPKNAAALIAALCAVGGDGPWLWAVQQAEGEADTESDRPNSAPRTPYTPSERLTRILFGVVRKSDVCCACECRWGAAGDRLVPLKSQARKTEGRENQAGKDWLMLDDFWRSSSVVIIDRVYNATKTSTVKGFGELKEVIIAIKEL